MDYKKHGVKATKKVMEKLTSNHNKMTKQQFDKINNKPLFSKRQEQPLDVQACLDILDGDRATIEGSVNGLSFLGENNKEYLLFPHPDALTEDQLKALAFQVLYYLHDNEKITKLY